MTTCVIESMSMFVVESTPICVIESMPMSDNTYKCNCITSISDWYVDGSCVQIVNMGVCKITVIVIMI